VSNHLLRRWPALLAAIALLAITATAALADDGPAFNSTGFAKLADVLGDRVGSPLTQEFATPDGTMQITSAGALYWHKDTGTLAFTDGYERAALIGNAVVEWVGDATDPPQEIVAPPISGAVARADCIISKESGGADVPNRQGSGASGPGQYFPGTWAAHVSLYRSETGYAGSLNMHNLSDVRRVMSYVLTIPGYRSAWTVGGC
jgi:hypothetical protein